MKILVSIILCLQVVTGFSQALKIDSLLRQLERTSNNEQRVKVLNELSSAYLNVNLFRAVEYSDQSIKLADKLGNDSLSVASRLVQATNYLQNGNYPRALELYTHVIHESGKINAPYMMATAAANIGAIHYKNGDPQNALDYYLTALEYFSEESLGKAPSMSSRRASIMNNVGIIYEERKSFDSAMYYYQGALALSEQVRDSVNIGNVLNNFGTLYRDKGNPSLAEEYYFKALQIREKYGTRFGIARSYLSLGELYFKTLHDNNKAEEYLKKAIEMGVEVGGWQTVHYTSDILYQLYYNKGDYKKALETYEINRQANDSLFNEESASKIAQLEMQSKFDKEQAEKELKQKEKELYFFIGGGSLVFLLVVVTLLYFLQRSKAKRSQLEQAHLELEKSALKSDLAIKDKELAANIMYLLNKNELINTISEKLLSIKQQVNAESQSAVQKVVLDLQSNLQPELWQEFEFRFQQVHENFYKILNEKFPDLSPSERRLCAFLKLDMTTKEISAITHQNAKSIDVARTRLRKKLNLTGTDHNLITFLAHLENEG